MSYILKNYKYEVTAYFTGGEEMNTNDQETMNCDDWRRYDLVLSLAVFLFLDKEILQSIRVFVGRPVYS